MRSTPFTAYLLGATAAAALLAGCSGGPQATALPGTQARAPLGAGSDAGNPDHSKLDALAIAPQYRNSTAPLHPSNEPVHVKSNTSLVFDSDPVGFSSSGPGFLEDAAVTNPPSGNINPFFFGVSNPSGLMFFKKDLYVANTAASNILAIDTFAQVTKTLDDPGEFPASIAATRDGTIYVGNIFDAAFAAGNVAIYAKGSTTPTSTLTSPSFFQIEGTAVNSAGDVFVNNDTGFFTGGQVIEFPGGAGSGTILKNIHVKIAAGLKIDPKTQDLLVVDQGTNVVKVYAARYTGHAKASYPVPNGGSSVDIALDATSSNLYFANDTKRTIDVLSYPAGTFLGSYGGGVEPIGVAVKPSRLP